MEWSIYQYKVSDLFVSNGSVKAGAKRKTRKKPSKSESEQEEMVYCDEEVNLVNECVLIFS